LPASLCDMCCVFIYFGDSPYELKYFYCFFHRQHLRIAIGSVRSFCFSQFGNEILIFRWVKYLLKSSNGESF
jgi:hypothetical protein